MAKQKSNNRILKQYDFLNLKLSYEQKDDGVQNKRLLQTSGEKLRNTRSNFFSQQVSPRSSFHKSPMNATSKDLTFEKMLTVRKANYSEVQLKKHVEVLMSKSQKRPKIVLQDLELKKVKEINRMNERI